MGKQISIYVDNETIELLKKTKGTQSSIFKQGVMLNIVRKKDEKTVLNDLPSEEEIREVFKWLPTKQELEEINEELENFPSEEELKDNFKWLPTKQELEEINEELDQTIEKLERIKELK